MVPLFLFRGLKIPLGIGVMKMNIFSVESNLGHTNNRTIAVVYINNEQSQIDPIVECVDLHPNTLFSGLCITAANPSRA